MHFIQISLKYMPMLSLEEEPEKLLNHTNKVKHYHSDHHYCENFKTDIVKEFYSKRRYIHHLDCTIYILLNFLYHISTCLLCLYPSINTSDFLFIQMCFIEKKVEVARICLR